MSNNFPVVPSDFTVQSIRYVISGPFLNANSADGTLNLAANEPQFGTTVNFLAPGTYGAFDQAAFEASLATIVAAFCQLTSSTTGQDIAQVQSEVTITRSWSLTDASGFSASRTDTLPYQAS